MSVIAGNSLHSESGCEGVAFHLSANFGLL